MAASPQRLWRRSLARPGLAEGAARARSDRLQDSLSEDVPLLLAASCTVARRGVTPLRLASTPRPSGSPLRLRRVRRQ